MALVALLLSACASSSPRTSSAAPPLIVCGQRIQVAAAGAVTTDLSKPGYNRLSASSGFLLYLRLSGACSRGSEMTVEPVGGVAIIRSVADGKGLPVFVVAKVSVTANTSFAISVRQAGLQLGTAEVDVTA